jgi:hypothetical protein
MATDAKAEAAARRDESFKKSRRDLEPEELLVFNVLIADSYDLIFLG